MGISFGLDLLYQKLKRIHKMIPIFFAISYGCR